MRLPHILLVIFVTMLWGFSFVVIEEGLIDMPPFLLCALRFFFTTFPAIFFVKKPNTSWKIIISYGLLMFIGMFGFSFFSIKVGLTAGLASLILQLQVFFTILLCVLFLKEKVQLAQIFGAFIALGGLAVVGFHMDGTMTLAGILCIVAAAICWGFANLTSKLAGKINMVGLIVWGSLFAWPLLLGCSFYFNGGDTVITHITHLSHMTLACVFYMAYPATLFCFTIWGWLLNHYRTAAVTPFALLVPIFGIASSMIVFDEPLQHWKIVAALLIVGGLCVNVFAPKLASFLRSGYSDTSV